MRVALMSVAIAALAAITPAAHAASFNVDTNARGVITAAGETNIGGADFNFVAGFFSAGQFSEDYRNFFQFSLPAFTGTVTSARLRIQMDPMGVVAGQSPAVDYQITSLAGLPDAADDFSALGMGTIYGTGSYGTSDNGTLVDLVLNNAGIAALTSGGSFLVGGRVTNAVANPDFPSQYVFGFSDRDSVSLQFDTAVTAVPEPESWAMMILAGGMAGTALRRRRTAVG